ncbi:hypothetical protein Tco_1568640 [Tanacetum coccineum]
MNVMHSSDVDEGPTSQTMFMANLTSEDPIYDEVGPSYDSNNPFEVQDHDAFVDHMDEYHDVHERQTIHLKESGRNGKEMSRITDVVKPLDSSLNYACRYTKLSQELLQCVIGTCPKSFNERDNKAPSTPVTRKKQVTFSDKPGTSSRVNRSTESSGQSLKQNKKIGSCLSKKENNKEKKADTLAPKPMFQHWTVYPPNTPVNMYPRILQLKEAPEFNSFFKNKNLEHQIKEKDNVIRHLKDLVASVNDRSREPYNAVDVTALIEQNNCDRVELEKVKQHYKELYDSIKIQRAHTSEKTSTMLNEIESLKAQLRSKEPCFTSDYVKPKSLAPHELLQCVIGTCPKSFNERDNKAPSTPVTRKKQVTFSDKPGTSSSNAQKHKVHQRVQLTKDAYRKSRKISRPHKSDIGVIFDWYAPSRKGYRIYNKRTRRLMETIHVTFDEMHQSMAPVHMSSGPAPFIMTPGQLKSGLAPTDKELEMLFQPMFDEHLEQSRVNEPVPSATEFNAQVVPPGTSLSTTIAQDAPSTSASSSTSDIHLQTNSRNCRRTAYKKITSIIHEVLPLHITLD